MLQTVLFNKINILTIFQFNKKLQKKNEKLESNITNITINNS